MEWKAVIVCITCFIKVSTSEEFPGDTTVCKPPADGPSKKFPPFQMPVYETKLEINLMKPYNLSIEAQQLIDQREQLKIKTRYWFDGNLFQFIFADDEAYTIHYPNCVTTKSDANKTGFGSIRHVHFDSTSFVMVDLPSFGLHIYDWEYIGTSEARGIPTDVWRTCIYYEPKNSTFNAEFQFSIDGYGTAGDHEQRPVRLKIKGQTLYDPTPESTEMTDVEYFVEYMWFRTHVYVPDFLFQVQFGVYCPDSKNQKQIPKTSQQFKLRSELPVPSYSGFMYFDEWYDYSMNLSRVDYTPISESTDYGPVPTTRIDDFNTGVTYIINNVDGNCSIQPIPTTDSFGRPIGQDGSLRMATAAELFLISDEYFYKGEIPIRDIDCDVYTDIYPDLGNVTLDWLISTNEWTATEEGNVGMTNIPIGLSVATTKGNLSAYEYSIFDFNNIHPDTSNFDISRCFDGENKARLQFFFEERYENMSSNLQAFISETQLKVSQASEVSPIRVQNLQVDYDTTRVYVEFTMTNRAPIEGSTLNPVSETTLEAAIEKLRTSIDNGNFYVFQFQAEPNSLRDDVSVPGHIDFKGDKTVCEPEIPYNTMPMPIFPPNYQLKIEGKILEGEPYDTEAIEYYDGLNKTAAFFYTHGGIDQQVIFDFSQKYLYRIQGSICSRVQYDSPDRIEGMFTLGTLIQLNLQRGNENYVGEQIIRGIPVNHWQSCVYWPKLESTFTIDWYFAKPEYKTSTNWPQTLVRTHIRGNGVDLRDPASKRDFDHIYDYFAFRSDVYTDGDNPFLIPPGTVCTGDIIENDLEIPVTPQFFTYKGEEIIPSAQYKFEYDQYYDYEYQLTRTDLKASVNYYAGSFYYDGPAPTSYIDDYNTGVSHIIDLYHGNCTIQKIPSNSPSSAIGSDQPVMRRASEMLFGNENLTFTYRGQYPHRELMADVWTTQVIYNEGTNEESTWILEVYYALETYQIVTETVSTQSMPIHIEGRKKNTNNNDQMFFVNTYDFYTNHPRSSAFDVSQCYRNSYNKHFQMTMPANYWSDIQSYNEWFKSSAMVTLARSAGVSPVRINSITTYFSESQNKVLMKFTMLVKSNLVEELTIDEATNALKAEIDSGTFIIKMGINGNTTKVKGMEDQGESIYLFLVDPKSFQEVWYQSLEATGDHGVGAVVGVSIGTFIFGVMLALLIMLYFGKAKDVVKRPAGGLPAQEILADSW